MADFSFWVILSNLLLAARWTVVLSLVAFVGGGLVGLASVVRARLEQPRRSSWLTKAYIEFFQGTPLLMQLFLFFFGLALFGVEVSPWVAASLALTLVDQRLPHRDLARLRRVAAARPVGGRRRASRSLTSSRCAT